MACVIVAGRCKKSSSILMSLSFFGNPQAADALFPGRWDRSASGTAKQSTAAHEVSRVLDQGGRKTRNSLFDDNQIAPSPGDERLSSGPDGRRQNAKIPAAKQARHFGKERTFAGGQAFHIASVFSGRAQAPVRARRAGREPFVNHNC